MRSYLSAANRTRFVSVVCIWLPITAACGDLPVPNRFDPTPLRPPIAEVVISGPSLPAVPGETVQLKAAVVFAGGAAQDVTSNAQWSSSASSIATVKNGVLQAVAAGQVEIRATYEEVTGRALFRVVPGR
jgi:hypothetical protein